MANIIGMERRPRARSGDRAYNFALWCTLVLFAVVSIPVARAEQSLGEKIKRIFEPTPTPAPKKKKSGGAAKKKSSPTPSPSPSASASSKKKTSPSPTPKRRASPSPTPEETAEESPIPKRKRSPLPSPSPSPKSKKKSSPTPSPSPEESETPSPSPEEGLSPSPGEKKGKSSGVTISPNEITGFDGYSEPVRKLIASALELASRNLSYKYGSADPANGGMDCSGFVYYLLRENGLREVPRDSSGQYVWVRKSGGFEAVVGKSDDTFELANLKPGDLLFWTGTYEVNRDPPITHAMIYLGKEKGTGRRIMVGSSDGRTYHDESRYGVSVFDFRVSRPGRTSPSGRTPDFVGYGRIPGLGDG